MVSKTFFILSIHRTMLLVADKGFLLFANREIWQLIDCTFGLLNSNKLLSV
jgi:hypothetical protein